MSVASVIGVSYPFYYSIEPGSQTRPRIPPGHFLRQAASSSEMFMVSQIWLRICESLLYLYSTPSALKRENYRHLVAPLNISGHHLFLPFLLPLSFDPFHRSPKLVQRCFFLKRLKGHIARGRVRAQETDQHQYNGQWRRRREVCARREFLSWRRVRTPAPAPVLPLCWVELFLRWADWADRLPLNSHKYSIMLLRRTRCNRT